MTPASNPEAAREAEARIDRERPLLGLEHFENWQYRMVLPNGEELWISNPVHPAVAEAVRATERAKTQPESALRAAARDARKFILADATPNETNYTEKWRILDALRAALDGTPYEPSEAEVERG